jgi:hypothetical protein
MTTTTLTLTAASKVAMRNRPREWGGWTRAGDWLCYPAYGASRMPYHIGLDQLETPYGALDMIDHVGRKLWATDACLAGLVRAIGDTTFGPIGPMRTRWLAGDR